MSTTPKIFHLAPPLLRRLPSPMRMLRSLHARLIAVDGSHLEHDILLDEVNRETDELLKISTESQQIEASINTLALDLQRAMADGMISPKEALALAREIVTMKAPAHEHTAHIKELL